jgi:hypothetical protein
MKVRRVVTGHDDKGRSVFSADEQLDPIAVSLAPGIEFHRIWGADQNATVPNQTSVPFNCVLPTSRRISRAHDHISRRSGGATSGS